MRVASRRSNMAMFRMYFQARIVEICLGIHPNPCCVVAVVRSLQCARPMRSPLHGGARAERARRKL
eukprot:9039926-Lingulodinium_polyedra.AAC.1